MNNTASRLLRVSYDGESWLAGDADGNIMPLMVEDAQTLPELPDGAVASSLLLPAEQLLCRSFALPLNHTRLIDQEILAQELEENSAEQAESWWLSWQAGRIKQGVAGLMFGLPETIRMWIDGHERWRGVRHVGVDIQARLHAMLSTSPATRQVDMPLAVLDADASGVCFGVWSPAEDADGFWLGMRRLNCPTVRSSRQCGELAENELADNIRRSLQAMGWIDENGKVLGRVPSGLQAALKLKSWQDDSEIVDDWVDLPDRNAANLAVDSESGLNFRHTGWRAGSSLGNIKPWRRTLLLTAVLALIWTGGMMWQNHRLDAQLNAAQQRIVAAFHKGLPQERVLIDALAQLRKAAGGNQGGVNSHDVTIWLRQIGDINRVYQKTPWKIKMLLFQDGEMSMSGAATDLQALNRIRAALQQQSGKRIKLKDTDLSGNQVAFRLVWS